MCDVKHKCHQMAGPTIYLCGYTSFYEENHINHYSSVLLIVYNKHCSHDDPHDHFIVVEINNDGNVIWLVGIYAPNHVVQYIVL